jgi:AcrR family transcriptional regulator
MDEAAPARSRPYHHGDLRRAVLAAAAEAIEESGPAALSLRELARRAGVSHAAPAHHFGDKAGLLTALAEEGFDLLAGTLAQARERTGSLLETGLAYVRFATTHPAHFEVMFHPDLYHPDDPAVVAARARATAELQSAIGTLPDPPTGRRARVTGLAAWSIAHGFATLWQSGAIPPDAGTDPTELGRAVLRRLIDRD